MILKKVNLDGTLQPLPPAIDRINNVALTRIADQVINRQTILNLLQSRTFNFLQP